MKYIYILLFLFIPFRVLIASELAEYENHYKNMNRLQGELETLELRKKIQKIEVEIYESKQSLIETKQDNALISANVILNNEVKDGFNPREAKLLYIIGVGKNKKAVISFENQTRILKNGSTFQGWRVKIAEKEVTIIKGSEVVTL